MTDSAKCAKVLAGEEFVTQAGVNDMTDSEVMAEITGLEFSYIVHYADGKTRKGDGLNERVSREEYRRA